MALHPHQKHCFLLCAVHTAGAAAAYVTHGLAAALVEIAAAATYFHMGMGGGGPLPPVGCRDSAAPAPSAIPGSGKDAPSAAANPAAADASPADQKDSL